MASKTVLLADDEQWYIEPLADALEDLGHTVIKATSVEEAIFILRNQPVDVITIDMMMDPGPSLENKVDSHVAGIYLAEFVTNEFPKIDAYCISVIRDTDMIKRIARLRVKFISKGDTPLRKVLDLLNSSLTGIAYSTESQRHRERRGT